MSRRPNSSGQKHWGPTHSSQKNQRGKGAGYLRLRDTAAHPPLSGSVTDAVPEQGTVTPAVENRVLLIQTTPRAAVPSPLEVGGNLQLPSSQMQQQPGWVVCSPPGPSATHRSVPLLSQPMPGPRRSLALWVCLVPKPPGVLPLGVPPPCPLGQVLL